MCVRDLITEINDSSSRSLDINVREMPGLMYGVRRHGADRIIHGIHGRRSDVFSLLNCFTTFVIIFTCNLRLEGEGMIEKENTSEDVG